MVFVTAVSFVTHLLVSIEHHPDQLHLYLGEYILMMFPMFWLWVGQTMFMNRYGESIKYSMLFMLPQMFFLILMTTSLNFEFAHEFNIFMAGYLGFRAVTVLEYFLATKKAGKNRKAVASFLYRAFAIGLLISLSSVLFKNEMRYIMMYLGIAFDTIAPLFFSRTLSKVPVNLPHLSERFSAFVLMAFGETLVSISGILGGEVTNPKVLTFSILCFILISLMWASYFYAYEYVIDEKKVTNGQILLYGHFFVLVSIMLMAAAIHLLDDNILDRPLLINFLFGAVLLFFISKHLIFYFHRKIDLPDRRREIHVVVIFITFLFLLNYLIQFNARTNLALLSLCCIMELIAQASLNKDILKILYKKNKK